MGQLWFTSHFNASLIRGSHMESSGNLMLSYWKVLEFAVLNLTNLHYALYVLS